MVAPLPKIYGIPKWRRRWRWSRWQVILHGFPAGHPQLVLGCRAHVTPRYYKMRTFNSQAATATGRTIDWKFCAEDAVGLLEKDYAFDARSPCEKFWVSARSLTKWVTYLVADYCFLYVIVIHCHHRITNDHRGVVTIHGQSPIASPQCIRHRVWSTSPQRAKREITEFLGGKPNNVSLAM